MLAECMLSWETSAMQQNSKSVLLVLFSRNISCSGIDDFSLMWEWGKAKHFDMLPGSTQTTPSKNKHDMIL
jgi:hypothetical protein